jgi:hypothetical protein
MRAKEFAGSGIEMKIELEVSDKNESTAAPYWLILDPHQNMKLDPHVMAGDITGPYFSREEAETHLKNRHYNFSSRAVVYCLSGYWSHQYKTSVMKALDQKNTEGKFE